MCFFGIAPFLPCVKSECQSGGGSGQAKKGVFFFGAPVSLSHRL